MPRFRVSMRGGEHVHVDAGNWLTALGLGLDHFGVVSELDRLACEVLPNGTVIARNARTGSGYVVQPAPEEDEANDGPDADGPPEAPAPPFEDDLDEETEVFATEPDTSSIELVSEELQHLSAADLHPLESYETTRSLLGRIRAASVPEAAWDAAVTVSQALVPCESGSGLSAEPDGALRFVAATGPSADQLAGVTVPAGKGIAAFSVTRRLGLIVNNPEADQRFYREVDKSTGYATRSILCVPVLLGGRTWGCIELLNPPDGAGFRREHLDQIDPVARILGARLAELDLD